jgi:myo-inositol-1(or 4)-monophosphatase
MTTLGAFIARGESVLRPHLQGAIEVGGVDPFRILECALLCANEGGDMIRNAVDSRESSAHKSHSSKMSAADLVTETDIAVEQSIRGRISRTFPSHLFVGEEGTGGVPVPLSERKDEVVWIVDPVDGTTNFVHGFPVVAVSIGVALGDNLFLGVVFNPLTDELWFAWKGCGAFMKRANSLSITRIHTSGSAAISESIISTGFGVPVFRKVTTTALKQQQEYRDIVEHNNRVIMSRSRDIRRIGSAACDICYVAMGRTDSFYEFGVREWDMAAGLVILREAGGVASTIGGDKNLCIRGRNLLVAASEELRIELCSALIDKNAVALIEAVEKS